MSRDITISEGGVSRGFGGTRKLKTALQGEGADSCYWVPEIETRVNPVFITENGIHEAAEAGEYGFSVAHVNIPEKHTDLDGNEWDITIDEDGIPHIEIDDIEITIDDEIGEVEINIDDQEIEIDPEEFELDPDEDIDVSIDVDDLEVDIVGTDLDGEDVIVDLDLETGEWDTEECPAFIKVVFPPNKTEYVDGDSINLTGLYVFAYNADGSVFRGGKYRDGRVPNSELSLSDTTANYDESKERATYSSDLVPESFSGGGYTNKYSSTSGGYIYNAEYTCTADASFIGYNKVDTLFVSKEHRASVTSDMSLKVTYPDKPERDYTSTWQTAYTCNQSYTYNGLTAYYAVATALGSTSGVSGANPPTSYSMGAIAWTILYGDKAGGEGEPQEQTISIGWDGPCGPIPTEATFDISVLPSGSQDSGSHYSGKF